MKTYYEIDFTVSCTKRTKMTDVELQTLLDEAHRANIIPNNEINKEKLIEVLNCDPQFESRLEEGEIVGSYIVDIDLKEINY